MTCLDQFLWARRAEGYNCLDFASDVWAALTGEDLGARLGNEGNSLTGMAGAARRNFTRLHAPASPCLVLMRGKREGQSHIGVFWQGKVMHLLRRPEYMELPVAARGFGEVRFYR